MLPQQQSPYHRQTRCPQIGADETMSYDLTNLREAAAAAGVSFQELDRAETDQLRLKIVARFSNGKDEWPIWESMGAVGVQDDEAWRWIADFTRDSVLLVFNKQDERQAVRFETAVDLVRALAEAPWMEFYICDPSITYLLCYNDHHYLIAAGTAKAWLRERVKSTRLLDDDIRRLRVLISAFVRGPDRSIERANEIELLMNRLVGFYELADTVVALASYRPEGGPFLNNEQQMVGILQSALTLVPDLEAPPKSDR